MRVTARPSPWPTSSMPSPREASSLAIIAWALGTWATAIASCHFRVRPDSAVGLPEAGTLPAREGRDQIAVVSGLARDHAGRITY
jgi:hypothetical protein